MFHTIIIVGNVGKDAEMRYTPSGAAVASFSVATNRQYTHSNGELIKETIWFRISAWGKQAEICNEYVKKGMKVLVEMWKSDNGEWHTSYEVTSSTVRFLSKTEKQESSDQYELDPEDDIPF